MEELKCYLVVNKYHQKGDRKPCLKNHSENPIEITETGKYDVAIWAPKQGKKAYFMLLKKVTNTEIKPESSSETENNNQNTTVKPIFEDSPFK